MDAGCLGRMRLLQELGPEKPGELLVQGGIWSWSWVVRKVSCAGIRGARGVLACQQSARWAAG